MERKVKVIQAPERPRTVAQTSIFLAGTTSGPDWRETLIEALAAHTVTIFNPNRPDWDSTWKEDFGDERWAGQVQWELEMQDAADIVVVFFHAVSEAPISLLEFGLCARSGKAIVCATDGYTKRGNVEAVCRRYGVAFVGTQEALTNAVLERLDSLSTPD